MLILRKGCYSIAKLKLAVSETAKKVKRRNTSWMK